MTLDIGIDFTKNTAPPREVVFTDWEARLVEHCLGLYRQAAIALDDVTEPLAASALAAVRNGVLPEESTKHGRASARRREMKAIGRRLDRMADCEHPPHRISKKGTCMLCGRDMSQVDEEARTA